MQHEKDAHFLKKLTFGKGFFVLFLRNSTTRPSKKCLCSRQQIRLEKVNTKPLSATLSPSPPTQHWGAHTPPALPRGSACRRFTSPQPLHGLPSPMPPPPPLLHQGHLLPAPAPSSRTCTLLQLYMPGLPAPSCPRSSHLPPCSAPPAQKRLSAEKGGSKARARKGEASWQSALCHNQRPQTPPLKEFMSQPWGGLQKQSAENNMVV